MIRRFRGESLIEILAFVQACPDELIRFAVLDPDRGRGCYAGERVELDGVAHVHRPWRVWIELADRLGLRLRTPRLLDDGLVELGFERLGPTARWTAAAPERYGADSEYARIAKAEEPGFVLDLATALARCALPPRPRVLDLGVNDGDELALVTALAPGLAGAHFVGVDHSGSALAIAQVRFPDAAFHQADLGALAPLGLGRFDLVIALGTLQSASVDDRALLRTVVQDHLTPTGAVILGVPNCRYAGGELVHGARIKNLREPELGLVVKDVAFYRKYLQQHGRRVFVTGHHTLLVTGVASAGA